MNSSTPPTPFDLRIVLLAPIQEFAPWFAAVLLVTWAGYPGIVCVTPVAWLLALRVGLNCVSHSLSDTSSRRILEATIAGGWFGFLQGLLFIFIVPRMGEIKPSEITGTIWLNAFMLIVGIFAAAGLSAFTAVSVERRRTLEDG